MCKCNGCTKREIGCHGTCQDYANYKAEIAELQKKRKSYPTRASYEAKVINQKTYAFVAIIMKGKSSKVAKY